MKPWRPSSAKAVIPTLPYRESSTILRQAQRGSCHQFPDTARSRQSDRDSASINSMANILNTSDLNAATNSQSTGDRFDAVLLRFSKLILLEGRKAVLEATAVAHDSYRTDMVRISGDHKEALLEKDVCIRQLTEKADELQRRAKTLTKQLMNMSTQLSRQSPFPFTSAQVFRVWYMKAVDSSPPRIYARFHSTKRMCRILYRWRVVSMNDSWKRKRDAALRTQADRHKSAIQSLHNQQDSFKSEISDLELKLKQEIKKRECFQSQLKQFIEGGFTDPPAIQTVQVPTPSLVSRACTLSNRRAVRRSKSCTPHPCL